MEYYWCVHTPKTVGTVSAEPKMGMSVYADGQACFAGCFAEIGTGATACCSVDARKITSAWRFCVPVTLTTVMTCMYVYAPIVFYLLTNSLMSCVGAST